MKTQIAIFLLLLNIPFLLQGKTTDSKKRDTAYVLTIVVVDSSTNKRLGDVEIKIIDNISNCIEDSHKMDPQGVYTISLTNKKLGDSINYTVILEKAKYLPKKIILTNRIQNKINIALSQQLFSSQFPVGVDISYCPSIPAVYFDFGKSDINISAEYSIGSFLKFLSENPESIIELHANTDCHEGDSSAQNKLCEQRAKSVLAYLVAKGVDEKRITYRLFASSRSLNACDCDQTRAHACTEEEYQQNRRVEFIIVSM